MNVEFLDPEPNGLAELLGELIRANLEHHPERVELLKRADVDITVPDAEVSVTVRVAPDRVTIGNGHSIGGSHLHVRADSLALVEFSSVPLRFGFPDPLTRGGRRVLGMVLRREIVIDGLVFHPGKLSRLSRLLSVV